MNAAKGIVLAFLGVAVVLQIVSLRTDHWAKAAKSGRRRVPDSNLLPSKGGVNFMTEISGDFRLHAGLWQFCYSISSETVDDDTYYVSSEHLSKCGDIPSSEENGKLKGARALIVISAAGALVSACLVAATFFRIGKSWMLLGIATAFLVVQALMQAGGVGLAVWWLDSYSDFDPTYDWSMYLGGVASFFYLLASVLGCVALAIEGRQPTRDGNVGVRYAQMVVVAEAV